MHRNDIDGLRTVAVLPVVASHFVILPNLFGGGFVGVDIFFVISGYLITSTLFSEVSDGTYSIVDFYNRRIRRIFPALFVVYAFCITVAFLLSFPTEAKTIGRSILSSIFFVSNYRFYGQSGYFDRSSETNPLLHTWSLSVEEQFYVVFPLIIYLMRNFSHRARVAWLGAATLVSFLYSTWMVSTDTAAAFYLVPSRAWELLIGSLLAVNAIPVLTRLWHAEVLGAVGIALIAMSVHFVSSTTPFPGVAALAPCIGTAAVIYSGTATRTMVARVLAFLPIRFCGLISYSIYLWHWPLIVFYRMFYDYQPNRLEKGALLIVCALAATISWKFIEKPFRQRRHRLGAYETLIAGGVAMTLTAAASFILPSLIERVFNYPSRAMEILSHAKIDESHMRAEKCFIVTTDFTNIIKNNCVTLKPNAPNYLILGDSHAAHLWSGLHATYPTINFLQATVAGCTPVIGLENRKPACAELMRYIFKTFLPSVHLNGIIISARWTSPEILPDLIKTADLAKSFADRVIIFGPIVEYDQALPRILARAVATHQSDAAFSELHRSSLPQSLDLSFTKALSGGPIQYISVYQALCRSSCETWATKDVPLQFDNSHLTCEGSIELAKRIGPQLFPDIGPTNTSTCDVTAIQNRAAENAQSSSELEK